MKMKDVVSSLAAAALLVAGAASAQETDSVAAPSGEGVSAEQGAPEGEPEVIVMQPEDLRASELFGTPVVDIEDTEIGELEDLVLSDDGSLRAVLAIGGIAGFGAKLVLVPWDRLEVRSAHDADGEPKAAIRLRGQTGRELADSEPRFRYEPE